MITKDIICITCPQGCIIKVSGDPAKGEIASCEGFKCPRGKKYAENEFIRPLRILTSSVKVEGASVPLVAVRTSAPIPKEMLLPAMEEVKKITSVYSQLSLSAEYISTLALHLAESGKFTATNLAKKAEGLAEKGIDSLEALCVYIEDAKSENGTDKEFRRLFGIWNRKLSRADREYFRRWSEDFGYSTEIVGEAYGIMTANNASGGVSLKYIDTILTHWHEAGCKTVAQCRAEEERSRAEKAEKNGGKIGRKKPEAKPKFVDFDVEDAFQRALQRSYGNGENDN